MGGTSLTLLLTLAAVCAARPADAFLQDLILQPLQEMKHALQPQPQPQPVYYQYRRAAYEAHPQLLQGAGYAGASRPAVYQWQQAARPSPYDVGTGYAYASNPFATFLQNPWFPWSNRQPQVQPQVQQVQQLSAPAAQQQQGLWGLLPWNSDGSQQQGVNSRPVLSFLQNPVTLWPWSQQAQQASRPGGVTYVTPVAPAPASSAASVAAAVSPFLQETVVGAPVASPTPAAVAVAAPGSKPMTEAGVVLDDDAPLVQHVAVSSELGDNGIRRVSLHQIPQDGMPCA